MTDYRKLDPGLAAAVDEGAPGPLSVFIHLETKGGTDAGTVRDQRAVLAGLGIRTGSIQGGIATAALTPEEIAELSERPWVRLIRSSTTLRLLGGGGPAKG